MFIIKHEIDSCCCLICGTHENVRTLNIMRNSRAHDNIISFGICNDCLRQAGESIMQSVSAVENEMNCKHFFPKPNGACVWADTCNCGKR